MRGLYDFGLHAQFIFCLLPDNNDLESQIPILVDVMSKLDAGEAAMADIMR